MVTERVAVSILGTSHPLFPQSSESVTLDLLTYTDLESLRSRKLGGRPGTLAPRSAQLNSKRYLILIYSVEFDRWAQWLAEGPGRWAGWEEPWCPVAEMQLFHLQVCDLCHFTIVTGYKWRNDHCLT